MPDEPRSQEPLPGIKMAAATHGRSWTASRGGTRGRVAQGASVTLYRDFAATTSSFRCREPGFLQRLTLGGPCCIRTRAGV